jgi:jumonji domain-containing protein 7
MSLCHLLQVEGSKTFILVDPSDNTRMYEGHMREAQLELIIENDAVQNKFDLIHATNQSSTLQEVKVSPSSLLTNEEISLFTQSIHKVPVNSKNILRFKTKHLLMESTSMVHSPVDITSPDYAHIPRMRCTVEAGDAIWVPSYWWHEVYSAPGPLRRKSGASDIQLNVAVNTWYSPLYKKEFPCAKCKKKLNREYDNILRKMAENGLF